MDPIKNYSEKKKFIKLSKNQEGAVIVEVSQFDSTTGKPLPPMKALVDLNMVLEKRQGTANLLKDFDEFIKDVKAVI